MPEEAKKTPETAGKPTNCMKCNKRLKRKIWYYKNNAYYCSKGCWQQAVKAAKAKKEKKA